jgi:hypothetical protein
MSVTKDLPPKTEVLCDKSIFSTVLVGMRGRGLIAWNLSAPPDSKSDTSKDIAIIFVLTKLSKSFCCVWSAARQYKAEESAWIRLNSLSGC